MFAKEVFGDKTVNSSTLTKKIFSELQGIILQKGYSVDGQQGFKKDQLISQLKHQADFVGKLDAKKLQKLLAQNDNNLYEIFSEYHSEIKGIIEKYRAEHTTDSLPGSSSTSSLVSTASSTAGLLNPEEHKEVKEPPKEPFSSDLGVLDNTATVEPARVRTKRSPLSSSLGSGSPKLQEVTSPRLPESLEDGWSQFVNDRMKKHALSTQTNGNEGDLAGPSTPESTRSNSLDAGMLTRIDSGSSTSTGNHFSQVVDSEELKRRLKGLDTSPNELVEQKRDSTSSGSPDSGKGSSGPSTPEKRRVSLTMEDIKGGNPQGKLRKVDLQQQASQIPVK